MLALKVSVKNAENAKSLAKNKGFWSGRYAAFSKEGYFYIPISRRPSDEDVALLGGELLEAEFKKFKPKDLAAALSEMGWGEAEISLAPRAFDLIGDIAILELRDELASKEGEVAKALMKVNPSIKVVAKKLGPVSGELRLRKLKIIGGEARTTTLHREAGCSFKVDVVKAWFSPRFAFERQRIASLVEPGEKVLALFAGVGPYPIVIAKKHEDAEVIAVELNRDACELMKENLRLNRITNVHIAEGDAREIVPKHYSGWANRIVMPLPLGGENFLDIALKAAERGCTIHFYSTGAVEDPFSEALESIKTVCEKEKRGFRILEKRIVLPYAPGIARIVVDFKVD